MHDDNEPLVLRSAPGAVVEAGGGIKFLVQGSLQAGSPRYEADAGLERIWKDRNTTMIPEEYLNQIITGDAREIAGRIPDESVSFIFTDPVYENVDDYRWLAETAARVLKPGGACLAWCGNAKQYEVQPVMSEYLRFVMPLTYTKIAKAYRAFFYKTFLWTTPCLWFQKGAHNHEWLVDTVIDHCNAIVSTDTPPKETYKWHKNPEAYIRWLQAFTKPGDVVYDPFTGSGSLPVECKRLGRNFIASEMKPDIADMARRRLAEVQVVAPEFLEEQVSFT